MSYARLALGGLPPGSARRDGIVRLGAPHSARVRSVPVGGSPVLRKAMRSDVPEIAELMRLSVLEVFPHFHDERETAAAARYLTEPDTVLIDDRTYFVHEADGQIVACGGWSKRDKLYTGSGATPSDDRLLDPATEPARVRAMFVRGDWTAAVWGARSSPVPRMRPGPKASGRWS
jgi:hypothetical protein